MTKPLIALMASADALFAPLRGQFNATLAAAISERREQFRRFGIPVPRTAGDPAERKRHERLLDELEASGSVTICGKLGRRTHWRLTDLTDWRLRRTATWSDWQELVVGMFVLREFVDAGHTNAGRVYELDLLTTADRRPDKIKLRVLHLHEIFAAGLARGLIASWSDREGRPGYSLSDSGRKFLDDPQPPDFGDAEYSSTANDAYLAELNRAEAELANIKPATPSHAAVPLSVGNWPDESTRPRCPSIFTARGNVRSLRDMIRRLGKPRRPR